MGTRPTGLSHERLWAAIDAIAGHNGLSPSALARRAGLSSTAFNRSKRVTADGRPRWPSTESIGKILATADADLADLVRLMGEGVGTAAGDPLPFPGSGVACPPGFAEGGAVNRR
ncbi:MAG: helix-turn-helix transcriptional regulator, partial [Siculibacillus sp.]|nr:helix-turn-helix transcriptional regulator [Siculibacillus sp.]